MGKNQLSHRSVKAPAFRTARVFTIAVFGLLAAASIASSQLEKRPTIEPLDTESAQRLADQRELVAALAARHVGSRITGESLNDLRIVQLLFDRYPARDRSLLPFKGHAFSDDARVFEIQALGVVVGDLMAHNFGLEWVVFEDSYGRGRALNVKGTRYLVFPVTLLSARYEASLPVDVRAMYDEIEALLTARPETPKNRRKLPPKPQILQD